MICERFQCCFNKLNLLFTSTRKFYAELKFIKVQRWASGRLHDVCNVHCCDCRFKPVSLKFLSVMSNRRQKSGKYFISGIKRKAHQNSWKFGNFEIGFRKGNFKRELIKFVMKFKYYRKKRECHWKLKFGFVLLKLSRHEEINWINELIARLFRVRPVKNQGTIEKF